MVGLSKLESAGRGSPLSPRSIRTPPISKAPRFSGTRGRQCLVPFRGLIFVPRRSHLQRPPLLSRLSRLYDGLFPFFFFFSLFLAATWNQCDAGDEQGCGSEELDAQQRCAADRGSEQQGEPGIEGVLAAAVTAARHRPIRNRDDGQVGASRRFGVGRCWWRNSPNGRPASVTPAAMASKGSWLLGLD